MKSTMNQFYRNKQGFIVMCDLSDDHSIKGVPAWLREIEQRATVDERVVMVLANKCDLLNEIDQDCVLELEQTLGKDFPWVVYREISVRFNLEVKESIQILTDLLVINKMSYAAQRLDTLIRQQSYSRTSRMFQIQDGQKRKAGTNNNALALSQKSRACSVATFDQQQLYYGSLLENYQDESSFEKPLGSQAKKKKSRCCKQT